MLYHYTLFFNFELLSFHFSFILFLIQFSFVFLFFFLLLLSSSLFLVIFPLFLFYLFLIFFSARRFSGGILTSRRVYTTSGWQRNLRKLQRRLTQLTLPCLIPHSTFVSTYMYTYYMDTYYLSSSIHLFPSFSLHTKNSAENKQSR